MASNGRDADLGSSEQVEAVPVDCLIW